MNRTVLLGPQQLTSDVQIGRVLRDLGVSKRVALVTAGWQERESDDAALVAAIALPAVNLRLHARSEEVFKQDPELSDAYSARQELLRHLQTFYRVRLDYADEAARAISVRHVEPELLEQEEKVSVELFRQLDRDHVERCKAIHAEFEAKWRLGERAAVARQREELRKLISGCEAVVISGGHVASLLNRLKLFDVPRLAVEKHLVGWSAGAMCLTDRIVLFHDYPPYGKNLAQVLDAGFELAPDVVVLPDPRRRIRLDDADGIARFAQRMAPASCLALDRGAHVIFHGRRIVGAAAELLTTAGRVEREVLP
jgi:hypothetical protein